MLECVVNVSEGRDPAVIAALSQAAAPFVLDVHRDPDHNRSVLTLAGPHAAAPGTSGAGVGATSGAGGAGGTALEEAVRALAAATVELVDLRHHAGAHPRIGALDVVPFVAVEHGAGGNLVDGPLPQSLAARDRFAAWAGASLHLPCFLYGPERSLPELRRAAWNTVVPERGPSAPHPTAGAAAVGARPVLVAYNLWLAEGTDAATARSAAARVRSPEIRTLGLELGERVQVSCNLVRPWVAGPGAAFDAVAGALEQIGYESGRAPGGIERAELVGLLPRAVLAAEPAHRWAELGIGPGTTIEARLEQAGLDGGSP